MKKYFAKYLPVEGEIKDDDMSQYNNITGIHSGWAEHCKGLARRVKLFLCSRDIEPGDKVYSDFDNGYLGIAKKKSEGFNFKMIGEISPEATWVKEGDEFDEEDVKEIWWHPKGNCETFPPRNPNQTHKIKRFLILGPCKCFH